MLRWGRSNGDAIACPLLMTHPLALPRCGCRQDPITLMYRETDCLGLPARCGWPELREREITRRERVERDKRPVSYLVRLARRGVL